MYYNKYIRRRCFLIEGRLDEGTQYGQVLDTCGECGAMDYDMVYDNQKSMYVCENCIEEEDI